MINSTPSDQFYSHRKGLQRELRGVPNAIGQRGAACGAPAAPTGSAALVITHKGNEVKTQKQIEDVLKDFDSLKNAYPGMTFEQGIEEALSWVLGDIGDDEFTPLVK